MKKMITLIFIASSAISLLFVNAQTSHVIENSGATFVPGAITIALGDTIVWKRTSGTHTTTTDANNIPVGALAWDYPLNASSSMAMYVPTVVGTYDYWCTPHKGIGMTGSFTVVEEDTSLVNGISSRDISADVLFNYNLNTRLVTFQFNRSLGDKYLLTVLNITGQVVYSRVLYGVEQNVLKTQLSDNISNGIYLINLQTNNGRLTKKIFVR